MNLLRKYIVKFFALDYVCRINIFGTKTVVFTRSANIIFPLILINIFVRYFEYAEWTHYVGLGALLLATFLGFFYFMSYPLQDKDLKYMDKVQKMQYEKWEKTYESSFVETNTIFPLLINPILTCLLILAFYLYS